MVPQSKMWQYHQLVDFLYSSGIENLELFVFDIDCLYCFYMYNKKYLYCFKYLLLVVSL